MRTGLPSSDPHILACSCGRSAWRAVWLPQLAGKPVDLCLAREGEREPVGGARRGGVDEDLVAVELLGDLGIDHRADDECANRFVAVVLQLMRAAPADGTGHDVSRLELADALERAKRGPSGQDDDHLLVAVMEVKRRAVPSGADLIQRCAEPLRACLCTHACGSSDQRRLLTLDPLRFEDVRHGTNLATRRRPTIPRSVGGGWPPAAPHGQVEGRTVTRIARVAGRRPCYAWLQWPPWTSRSIQAGKEPPMSQPDTTQ